MVNKILNSDIPFDKDMDIELYLKWWNDMELEYQEWFIAQHLIVKSDTRPSLEDVISMWRDAYQFPIRELKDAGINPTFKNVIKHHDMSIK